MTTRRLAPYLPPAVDIGVAALLVAMGVALAIGNERIYEYILDDYESPDDWIIVGTAMLATAPLAFRRVFPLGSLVALTCGLLAMAIYNVVEISATTTAYFVGLVSAGIYGRDHYRDWARGLFALALLVVLVALFISRSGFDADEISPRVMTAMTMAEFVGNAGFVGLGWYLGDVERRRRATAAQLEARNDELQAALQQVEAQAANEERLAIAREVHDVVGHTVSLLGVQAAAARRQVGRDPKAAETTLRTMEEQSRNAVDEIRGLISVLRRSGPAQATDPSPSLVQLDDLIDQVRAAGAEVSYSRTGPSSIGAGLGLSIYRVVQEAVSNAIRHGTGGIEIVVAAEPEAVRVFVSNDMADDRTEPELGDRRPGSGLAGMQERVGLHDGTLSVGRQPDGRFALRAVFPVTVSGVGSELVSIGAAGPGSDDRTGVDAAVEIRSGR